MSDFNFIKMYESEYDPSIHGEDYLRYIELCFLDGSNYKFVNGICRIRGELPPQCTDTYLPVADECIVNVGDCVDLRSMEDGTRQMIIYNLSNLPPDELRLRRNNFIKACDWLVSRHLSQPDNAKTLSPEQYAELQNYMQALRDLPATADLSNITWPAKPSFI
jgi:hypothetical protein